ncbi:DUF732 domain-containing protein [Nostoc sp. CMAA1605]|uniref:DUF732 domain-containing protein n=1 Tax=Nostoc sp. CMAA1605 TaxID=2055159 RepID=UPI001F186307|nr:DUF732 domain-containing protein [Nostoc sp. CMAA1605]MCF4970019.1 hypothetical protein [Nostoc sp. CMAA1605]
MNNSNVSRQTTPSSQTTPTEETTPSSQTTPTEEATPPSENTSTEETTPPSENTSNEETKPPSENTSNEETTPPSENTSVPSSENKQLNQTDLAFIADIESFARNNGTTFSDVTPEQNVKTARDICTGVKNNGASTAIKTFFNAITTQNPNLTEGEKSALGYIFSASVKYYCPQYLPDVRNFLANEKAPS